ncbi:serine/threonine protein kinase [Pseudarthrobacter phenanthrenivorans]|uniref:non-specific serine/threonine protein kinase n=1 Tax=Pseudarthrobacter phenanthrenivorans (strain DSM 18606 / JCM 16027 / LMG 23796 / Sphe3) TaxID=930171 RepID=F0M994_PSEPM|nr:serine/threonine-protein kinase [Pseudarthrobacter phenanthrenivorans]ADX74948.1 protein kinase family protein [Pseudarthrobacter phenanthrenivorans Sphe3]TPV49742.1 serine/threonine protein kinase [Pseudarthrobacter phenanthrenivorans]
MTAGTPLLIRTGQHAGQPIVANRYQLKELLGRGSLAEVFRAVDRAGGPDVAVKVAVGTSGKHILRINTEADVLAAVQHPSIVRFIRQGVMPAGTHLAGRPFLVEELALGTSLAEACRSGACTPGTVAGWATGLFSALAHLHGQGLVHRDIKPGNLMLSGLRRSPVRIIDFGIAAADGAAPEPGISSGTVHYMSPEQASGGPARASWDVYAMGLVLLELLTGSKAFPGTAIESLVARTLRSPDVPDSLGPRWCSFLRSLTAMDSAERPTAAEAAGIAARLIPVPLDEAGSQCRRMAVFPARRIRQLA